MQLWLWGWTPHSGIVLYSDSWKRARKGSTTYHKGVQPVWCWVLRLPLCQQCSKLHDCSASSSPISGGLLCQSFQWFLPTKRSIASQVTVHGLGTGMTVGYSSPGSPHSPRAAGTAGIAITPSLETEEEKVCLKTQTILTHSPFNCISELPNCKLAS